MVLADSLVGNSVMGRRVSGYLKVGDTTLKTSHHKHTNHGVTLAAVTSSLPEEEEEEPDEDDEIDIRNLTESEMQSYYSMKALKKVYVKPALPLKKAKNTSLQDFKIVKLLG
jgi:hypothetical protein